LEKIYLKLGIVFHWSHKQKPLGDQGISLDLDIQIFFSGSKSKHPLKWTPLF